MAVKSEGEGGGDAMRAENAGNSTAKRLIITHMTLENFKSYAGIQEIGPFHKVWICYVLVCASRC